MRLLSYLILLFAFLSGCSDDSISPSGEFESESNETQFVVVSTQTGLNVENTNGTITISVSDTASGVSCDIKKKVVSKISESDAQSHLSDIIISFTGNNPNVEIEVSNPSNDNRNYEIALDILLPDNFNFDLNLGNGNVTVNSATKNLVISLGNGNVESNVILADTCFSSVSIGNGNLNFTIPDSTNAILVASVGNGLISNNGLNFQNQQITSRQFIGTLGNGIGNIALSVGNGNITMNKR